MPKGYVTIGSNSKRIQKIDYGVDGVARKIIKGWAGVNGVARLMYSHEERVYIQNGTYTDDKSDYVWPATEKEGSINGFNATLNGATTFYVENWEQVKNDIGLTIYEYYGVNYNRYLGDVVSINNVNFQTVYYEYWNGPSRDYYYYLGGSGDTPTKDHIEAISSDAGAWKRRFKLTLLKKGRQEYDPQINSTIKRDAFSYGYNWEPDPVGEGWVRGELNLNDVNDPTKGAYYIWTRTLT